MLYLCIVKRLNKNEMKEMFVTLKEQWNENPKEMIKGMLFMILWVCLTYFLFWFGSMFCYDM